MRKRAKCEWEKGNFMKLGFNRDWWEIGENVIKQS